MAFMNIFELFFHGVLLVQRFKGSKVQGFNGSRVRWFEGSWFNGSAVKSFMVEKARFAGLIAVEGFAVLLGA